MKKLVVMLVVLAGVQANAQFLINSFTNFGTNVPSSIKSITPIFVCGGECGQMGSVGQHWAQTGAAFSFDTTTKRNGARAFRCNPSAAANTYISCTSLGNQALWVVRVAVRFATLPSNNQMIVFGASSAAGVAFKQSDSKLYPANVSGGVIQFGADGVSVTTGVWYLLNCRVNTTPNPALMDLRVDSTDCTQWSHATPSGTPDAQIRIGTGITASTTADIYYDDFVVTATTADHPVGDGYVNHFVPTADGTHNVAGAADFRRGDTTTDILNSTTTAYQLVDDVPLDDVTPDTDDHIRIVAPPNVTDYVECVYGPASGISTPTIGPRGVEVIAEFFAAGTGLADEIFKINDNGTVNNVYDGTGIAGTTSGIYKRKHYATAPSTSTAWTSTLFNNLRFRYGFATDANPDKSLMATMIEAEFGQ